MIFWNIMKPFKVLKNVAIPLFPTYKYTACCRVKQPKQKSPRGLSILQTKMMIGHSEFIAKTICQQPPLGATALNPGQN